MAAWEEYLWDRACEKRDFDLDDCPCYWETQEDGTRILRECDDCAWYTHAEEHRRQINNEWCSEETCEFCDWLRPPPPTEPEVQPSQLEIMAAAGDAWNMPVDPWVWEKAALRDLLAQVAALPIGPERIEAIRRLLICLSGCEDFLRAFPHLRGVVAAKMVEFRADPLGSPLLQDIAAVESVCDRASRPPVSVEY
jgi:hypothetical protein